MAGTVRGVLNLIPQRSMESAEQEASQAGASCTTSQAMGSDKGSRPLLSITPQKAYVGILHLNRDMYLKANPERLRSTKEPVKTFPSSETRATIISHCGKNRLYLRNSIVESQLGTVMSVVEGFSNGTAFQNDVPADLNPDGGKQNRSGSFRPNGKPYAIVSKCLHSVLICLGQIPPLISSRTSSQPLHKGQCCQLSEMPRKLCAIAWPHLHNCRSVPPQLPDWHNTKARRRPLFLFSPF